MQTSETIGNLLAALSAAQGEIQNAEKDTKAYGYMYADLAQILSMVRPILAKHKLAVIQLPHNADGGIAVTTRLGHESGEWLEDTLTLPVETSKNLSIAQESGKVISYARRYMLSAMLGVAQEDTDATKRDSKGQTQETQRKELPRKKLASASDPNKPNREQLTALQKSIADLKLDVQEVWEKSGCTAGKWSLISVDDYKKLSQTVLNMSASDAATAE